MTTKQSKDAASLHDIPGWRLVIIHGCWLLGGSIQFIFTLGMLPAESDVLNRPELWLVAIAMWLSVWVTYWLIIWYIFPKVFSAHILARQWYWKMLGVAFLIFPVLLPRLCVNVCVWIFDGR